MNENEKPPSQDPNQENIELEIQKLLNELREGYHPEQFPEDLREEIARERESVEVEIKDVERTPK